MKKLLFTTFFVLISGFAMAQIVYTPFTRKADQPQYSQSYEQPQYPQSYQQTVRTTGYAVDKLFNENEEIEKLPIKVTIKITQYPSGSESQEIFISSYYDYNSQSWQTNMLPTPGSKTSPYMGNELEQSFMYKASVEGRKTVYFDM